MSLGRGTVNLRSCGRSANRISLIRHTRPGESRRRTGEKRPRTAQVDSADSRVPLATAAIGSRPGGRKPRCVPLTRSCHNRGCRCRDAPTLTHCVPARWSHLHRTVFLAATPSKCHRDDDGYRHRRTPQTKPPAIRHPPVSPTGHRGGWPGRDPRRHGRRRATPTSAASTRRSPPRGGPAAQLPPAQHPTRAANGAHGASATRDRYAQANRISVIARLPSDESPSRS
jgi:hypothetical protein